MLFRPWALSRYEYLKDHLGSIRMTMNAGDELVTDDFSGGTLTKWTVAQGSGFSVVNGELRNSSGGENILVNASSTSFTDGYVQANVKCLVNFSHQPSIIFRYQNPNNFYYVSPVGGGIRLYEKLNGTVYTRAQVTMSPSVQVNTWYTLRVEAKGGTFTVYWNGQKKLTWTDTTPWLSGKVGFRQEAGQSVAWDNMFSRTSGALDIVAYDAESSTVFAENAP